MKLSTKIFLPIILISALLILLSGCAPTTPSPGAGDTTGGTITGIFETPEACCISNRDHTEGWVPLVNATVSVIDVKGVTHTTKTDSDGKYWLTDVAPGIYYVVTACCECEDREGVYKDVVEEELLEGETYDAGIADCESTALGLMVDYLLSGDVFVEEECNCYCNCFDEESQIYASLVTTGVKLRVAAVNLQNIPSEPLDAIRANADFQAFVVELCDLLEACCVEPGVTPPPPPPPPPPGKFNLSLIAEPWEGAEYLTGAGAYNQGTQNVAVDTKANPCYEFIGWSISTGNATWVTGDWNTEPLEVDMNGNVTLTAHFECPLINPDLEISIIGPAATLAAYDLTKVLTPDLTICMDECATIDSVTVNSECQEGDVFPMVLEPPYDPSVLNFVYDDNNITFDYDTGEICLINGLQGNTGIYTIDVSYTDPCGNQVASGQVVLEFEDCNIKYTLTMAVFPVGAGTTVPSIGAHSGYVKDFVENISASANAGYHFVNWTVNTGAAVVAPDSDSTTVVVDTDKTVTANFETDVCAEVTLAADWTYAYRHCTNELLYWWAYCGAGRCDPPAKIRDHLPIIVTIVEGNKSLDNGTITLKIDTAKLAVQTGPTPDGSGNIVLTIDSSGTGVVEELIVKKAGILESPGTQDWTDTTDITVEVLQDAAGASACFTSNTLTIDGDDGPIDG